MKIALIGNTNNNNFSIMRYFRDEGIDAHLFPFSNESDHFFPDSDTFELDKWNPYIHPLRFATSATSFYKTPANEIKGTFQDFDYLISSGLTPALLSKAGLRLDIFYSHSYGVEYVGTPSFFDDLKKMPFIKRLAWEYVLWHQKKGLKAARKCIAIPDGITEHVFKEKLKRDFLTAYVPMVYFKGMPDKSQLPDSLITSIERIESSDFSVFSHCRQLWYTPKYKASNTEIAHTKNNDWLVTGFKKFVDESDCKRPLLVLLDYGIDVKHTKDLISELNLDDYVLWIEKSPRKHLMLLLKHVTVGIGEFANQGIWGGTAWEVLSAGKPLLQSINFSNSFHESLFNIDLPPALDVKSERDVYNLSLIHI